MSAQDRRRIALSGRRSNCVIVIGIVCVYGWEQCYEVGMSSPGGSAIILAPAAMTKKPGSSAGHMFPLHLRVRLLRLHAQHPRSNMNVLVLLSLLLFIPFLFFLAFLAISSCMGDGFRARISGMSINPRHGSYGRGYARGLGSGAGSAGWEQIEMEDMMGEDSSDDDLPHEH